MDKQKVMEQLLRRKKRRGILIACIVGLIMAGGVAVLRGFNADADSQTAFSALSDGCFIAGFMLTAVGALTWVSGTGFFDIFGYAMHSLLVLFTPLRRPQDHEKFIDYKERKSGAREKPLYYLLLIGVVLIFLAVLFLLLWYSAA